jgi:hypothetical protein
MQAHLHMHRMFNHWARLIYELVQRISFTPHTFHLLFCILRSLFFLKTGKENHTFVDIQNLIQLTRRNMDFTQPPTELDITLATGCYNSFIGGRADNSDLDNLCFPFLLQRQNAASVAELQGSSRPI